jgi:16S rRNA (guanine527-N7)-methyltransferase
MVKRLERVRAYFPEVSDEKHEKLEAYRDLLLQWNERINLISRKDVDNIELHHILHSLAIAKIISFLPDSRVLDVGTGGGLPGIPLAILFPETEFVLIDRIGKKVDAVKSMIADLKISNVSVIKGHAADVEPGFDFIVSRAVTRLNEFTPWIKGKLSKTDKHPILNGILYLKGGEIEEELLASKWNSQITPISDFFSEDFFQTKNVVYLKQPGRVRKD